MNLDKYKFTKYFSANSESRWANEDEIIRVTEKLELGADSYPCAGLPIINDGNTAYVDDKDNHSLIFGSTGSKKSRLFCMPTLRFLIGAGESFVVTDPKGELFDRTSGAAKENGYNIVVLNYRDLLHSDSWNPFAVPYNLYHSGDKEAAIARINDFINAISEKHEQNTKDIFWINAAKSVAVSILVTMLEVCTIEECNLKTFTRFCTEFAKGMTDALSIKVYNLEDSDIIKNSLHDLMQLLPPDSIARLNYDGIAGSSDKAKGDVQSMLFTLVGIFLTQESLVKNMSCTSFDLDSIGTTKTAVYLIVPDERTSYHFIATTFIKQCYELLIIKAQSFENRQLPVRVNFVLDEFANMPKVPDMPSMISAARSRNIRFFLVLQSMHQMREKYSDEAETIKGNCENWVFLASKEINLLEEISSLCGKVASQGEFGEEKQPLISISQLQRLNKQRGEALIFCGRQYPFITEMADIDDCNFENYPSIEINKVELSKVVSTDPKEIYDEIISRKRIMPFSENGGLYNDARSSNDSAEKGFAIHEDPPSGFLSDNEESSSDDWEYDDWEYDGEEEYYEDNDESAEGFADADEKGDMLNKSIERLKDLKKQENYMFNEIKDKEFIVAGYYDILENAEGDFLFVVNSDKLYGPPDFKNPKFYYDGQEHGIFASDNAATVICDFIIEQLHDKIKLKKEVLFLFRKEGGEVELENSIVVPVIIRRGTSDAADSLIDSEDCDIE